MDIRSLHCRQETGITEYVSLDIHKLQLNTKTDKQLQKRLRTVEQEQAQRLKELSFYERQFKRRYSDLLPMANGSNGLRSNDVITTPISRQSLRFPQRIVFQRPINKILRRRSSYQTNTDTISIHSTDRRFKQNTSFKSEPFTLETKVTSQTILSESFSNFEDISPIDTLGKTIDFLMRKFGDKKSVKDENSDFTESSQTTERSRRDVYRTSNCSGLSNTRTPSLRSRQQRRKNENKVVSTSDVYKSKCSTIQKKQLDVQPRIIIEAIGSKNTTIKQDSYYTSTNILENCSGVKTEHVKLEKPSLTFVKSDNVNASDGETQNCPSLHTMSVQDVKETNNEGTLKTKNRRHQTLSIEYTDKKGETSHQPNMRSIYEPSANSPVPSQEQSLEFKSKPNVASTFILSETSKQSGSEVTSKWKLLGLKLGIESFSQPNKDDKWKSLTDALGIGKTGMKAPSLKATDTMVKKPSIGTDANHFQIVTLQLLAQRSKGIKKFKLHAQLLQHQLNTSLVGYDGIDDGYQSMATCTYLRLPNRPVVQSQK